MKSFLFWIFLAIAIGLGIYSYLSLRQSKKPSVDAFTLLPDSCLVYLSTSNLHELDKKVNEQSLIADRLKLFPQISDVFRTVSTLDSMLLSQELLKEQTSDVTMHFGAYSKGRWLVSFNIKELGQQEKCLEAMKSSLNLIQSANQYAAKINGHLFYFHLRDGVVLITNNSDLTSIALSGQNKFYQNQSFIKFKSALSEDHLFSLFVNQTLYSKSDAAQLFDLAILNKGFCAGTVDLEPSELKVNGVQACDSSSQLSGLIKQAPVSTSNIISLLPYNTLFFEAFGADQLNQVFKNNDQKSGSEDFWKGVNEKALYNVRTQFIEQLGNHILRFRSGNTDDMIAVEITDSVKADESLAMMSDSIFRIDSVRVFRLRSEKEPPLLFQPLIQTSSEFAVRLGAEIYFSNKESELRALIMSMNRQINLLQNQSFVNYENQNFPDRFHYLLYVRPSEKNHLRNTFFKLSEPKGDSAFENFRHFSYSLAGEKDYFKFRFHLLHESENKQKNLLWTIQLDTTVVESPQMFSNHLSQENEILVQDQANTLYLINAKGSLLWKKKLDEKILSKIYIVDAYRNNKLQMLFNTRSAIHLLDRNGHYVEGYPVTLPAPATNAMSVFDYDSNKEYRLFVACTNRSIYNYAMNGKKQEGFTAYKTEAEVHLPIQYMSIGQSQYLVALDKEGRIYTFSRKGINRINLRNRAITNCKGFYLDESASLNNSYIVYLDDKTSILNKISFSDVKSITRLNADADGAAFQFKPIDENRSTDLLLTAGNRVAAYDLFGNLIVEKEGDESLNNSDFYNDESRSLIYSFSRESGLVLVHDLLHDTETKFKASAFPALSDLFRDQKMYLILPDGNSLNCLILN